LKTGHKDNRTRINEGIRAPEVRVIDEEKGNLGVMATAKALEIAEEQGLDLIEISPNAKPPIAKIMDYGKYAYDEKKKPKPVRLGQWRSRIFRSKLVPVRTT
jgi:translation initiation factor IF-3